MKNLLKSERGSVTVEATISLTAFMFAIITILTMINISTVQAKMSVAINTTAKEISQYSYLYGLTGFNQSNKTISDDANETKGDIDGVITNVNAVFNEIGNLGKTAEKVEPKDPTTILEAWDDVGASLDNVGEAKSKLEEQFKKIGDDPKQFIFGITKLIASEGLELAKSKLIAAPLSKAMVQKHLKNYKNDSTENFLQTLGVVPSKGSGKYIDGLDFGESTLFPYGSDEIKIVVTYKVKVIALLPIKKDFTFTQTALTHGWLGGDKTYEASPTNAKTEEEVLKDNGPLNNGLWVGTTPTERSRLIKNIAFGELQNENYFKVGGGINDIDAYSKDKNEIVYITTSNPLYTAPGADPVTVDNMDKKAIEANLMRCCTKINSTSEKIKTITVISTDKNGNKIKENVACVAPKKRIILAIPEDDRLKDEIQKIINGMKTDGV
ncbi:MAG: hypothetical protein RSA99_00310, partial [Oscillospiraceae bacterium]